MSTSGESPRPPRSLGEATTIPRVLEPTTSGRGGLPGSRYWYYERPFRAELRRLLGSPSPDILAELTQLGLIKLYEATGPEGGYDPSLGPLRPYVRSILHNLVADHYRGAARDAKLKADLAAGAAPAAEGGPDLEMLEARLHVLRDRYLEEIDDGPARVRAEDLFRVISGEPKSTVARDRGVSLPTQRKHEQKAAVEFWRWAERQFHPDDWVQLVRPQYRERGLLPSLRWISSDKRTALVEYLVDLLSPRDA